MENHPIISVSEVDENEMNTMLGISPPTFPMGGNKKADPAQPITTDPGVVNTTEQTNPNIIIENENEIFGINTDPIVENTETTEQTTGDLTEDEIFPKLGEGLSKLGVLSLPEDTKDFKWNQDTFIERLEVAKQEGANTLLADFLSEVEGGEELFQTLFVDKVPVSELAKFERTITDYSNVDITTIGPDLERNQVKVVSAYLREIGNDEEEIQNRITYLKDTNKLGQIAESYKNKLVENISNAKKSEIEKAKTLEQSKIREKQNFQASIANELREAVKAKEIDGFPVTPKDAQELYDYGTKIAGKIEKTGQELTNFDLDFLEIRKDPKKFVKLLKLVKNGLEIKEVVKKKTSEATSRIFSSLDKESKKNIKVDPFLKVLTPVSQKF